MNVSQEMYSLWSRRYWFFFLSVSSGVFLGYHSLCNLILQRSAWVSPEIISGSACLLLGALVLQLPSASTKAEAFVLTSLFCVVICEIYSWLSDTDSRFSTLFLVVYLTVCARLRFRISLLVVFTGLVSCLLYAGFKADGFIRRPALLGDQLVLWLTAFLCFLTARRESALHGEVIDAVTDHLMYRKKPPGGFFLYDLPPVRDFDSRSFRRWLSVRREEFFGKHSLLVAVNVVLFVAVLIPYERWFELGKSAVGMVQISATVLMVISLVFASLVWLFRGSVQRRLRLRHRARLVFVTAVCFLLASLSFSAVFAVTRVPGVTKERGESGLMKEASRLERLSPITSSETDAWLFTCVASLVLLDEFFLIASTNVVILGTGMVFFKYLAGSPHELLFIYTLQYLAVFSVLFIHKLRINSLARLLFSLSDPSEPPLVIQAIGIQRHMNPDRTLYHIAVNSPPPSDGSPARVTVFVTSTKRLRERLARVTLLAGLPFPVLDERFDLLSPDSASPESEKKVLSRLSGVLSRIGGWLLHVESCAFFGVFGRPLVPRLKVTVQTVGSRGDVQPFIFVARELENSGHKAVVATHEKFRSLVESHGVRFFPLALKSRPDHWQPEQLMKYAENNPGLGPDLIYRPRALFELASSALEMTHTLGSILVPSGASESASGASFGPLASVADADAIIANPPSYAHIHLAEALGLPLHLVFTMPWTPTTTVGHPICVSSAKTNAFWNRLSYRWMQHVQWRGVSQGVNAFRRGVLGLSGMNSSDVSIVDKWNVPFAYIFSNVLMPKPPDWGPHIDVVGFVSPPPPPSPAGPAGPDGPGGPGLVVESSSGAGAAVAAEERGVEGGGALERWVEENFPIYVGFGSITSDLTETLRIVGETARTMPDRKFLVQIGPETNSSTFDFPKENVALVVPKGRAEISKSGLFPVTFEADSLDHVWLFPRCSAVVHHGGAGTTAAGLAAGRPTVVCAFFGDQVIWGQMVERLKCGSMVLAREMSREKFVKAVKAVLKEETRLKAEDVGRRLQEERQTEGGGGGAKGVVEAFERQLAVELVVCELCERRKAERELGSLELRVCGECGEGVGDFREKRGLRLVDWGHERRERSMVMGGINRVNKAIGKLKKRPIQGFDAIGVAGLAVGLAVAVLEIAAEVVRLPYHSLCTVATAAVDKMRGSAVGTVEGSGKEEGRRREGGREQGDDEEEERGKEAKRKALEVKLLREEVQYVHKEMREIFLAENFAKLFDERRKSQ